MAPGKGNKPEINPWGWVYSLGDKEIGMKHILQAYRISTNYKLCDVQARNCKRNPFCYWGMGEKKWVHDSENCSEDEDDGFREREEGEFAGLQNLGATCYVNSLLQLWFHNPILRPAILKWMPQNLDHSVTYRPNGPIAQLQAMFARMKMTKKSKIDTCEFVTALQLNTGEQQDAQEFSKLFMDVILNLLVEYTDGTVTEAIKTTFRGEMEYETECTGCGNKTKRQESFTEIELSVRKNINESLDDLLKDELLAGSDQYSCYMCDKLNDAHRRTKIMKLPPVLNFQLMRFVYDRETNRKKKVTTMFQFPEVLDMTSRVSEQTKNESGMPEPLIYHLIAVLIHNGQSASSGHYVAEIKDLESGVWNKFNDESVNRVNKPNKSKRQTLVLKDDEGSGSDDEKSKPKKTKIGTHRSMGAYMLVYTLEKHTSPEADPELWPHLVQMVKAEDAIYEEELKRTKTDKYYENSLKEQRKREISMLYPNLQLNGKTTSDDEQPPKKKFARGKNGKEDKNHLPTNGVDLDHHPTTQATLRSSGCLASMDKDDIDSLELKRTVEKITNQLSRGNCANMIEKLDFIPSEWMHQWLDVTNPPAPMENKSLACEHNKLKPPSSSSTICLYKALPSAFAERLYLNYSSVGPKFSGSSAFCKECVKVECQRLQKLKLLDDDFKLFNDCNKELEMKLNPKEKNREILNVGIDCCWISRDAAKNWKRLGKRNIEKEYNTMESCNTHDLDELAPETDGVINADLVCSHGNLVTKEASRKLIPRLSWDIINRYFQDAILMLANEWQECEQCQNEQKGDAEVKSRHKEFAVKLKPKLLDLYHSRNRPNIGVEDTKEVYIVSVDFVNQLIAFLRDPTKTDPVSNVNNKTLLCQHGKFKYPLNFLSDVMQEVDPQDETIRVLHSAEWTAIKDNFNVDEEISARLNAPNDLAYTPELCQSCATEWWLDAYRRRFDYENESITIIHRKVEEDQYKQDDFEEEGPELIKSNKRERRAYGNPTLIPKWSYKKKQKEANSDSTKRSFRPRRQKGEKEKSYNVASTMTLRDIKLLDSELLGDSSTLGELEIPPNSTLILEIDTATKEVDDPSPLSKENGFRGTLLMAAGAGNVDGISSQVSLMDFVDEEPEELFPEIDKNLQS